MDSKQTSTKLTNFIRNTIDKDLLEGKHKSVITRFPPEPNGYLHIGHAKSICLNFGTASDYDGFCNLRFDDTNPCEENIEYVDSIKKDVKWLGFSWNSEVKFSSSYFDVYYDCAIELIKKGLAYVCFLNSKQMREFRGTLNKSGKNSPYRNSNAEENLRLFEKMKSGEFKEGECVLRAKIDMASPNMLLRDPVMYRILYKTHHRTGDDWCIYPMYDWTHGESDYIEQISHSLCTLEFEPHRELYDWFLDQVFEANKIRPKQREFARLNLSHTITSKRKLMHLVDKGHVSGWDDPRMPTV